MGLEDRVHLLHRRLRHRPGQRLAIPLPVLQERRRSVPGAVSDHDPVRRSAHVLPGVLSRPVLGHRRPRRLESGAVLQRCGLRGCHQRGMAEHLLHRHPGLVPLLLPRLAEHNGAVGIVRQLVEHQDVRQRLHPRQPDVHHDRRQPHALQPERHALRGHEPHRPRQGVLGTPSADDFARTRGDRRPALGTGRNAGRRLAALLLLHLEGRQVDGQGGLLHGPVPLLPADGAAHPRSDSARRRRGHRLLPDAQLVPTARPRGLDRRRHADLLLVRPRRRLAHRPRQLQQVQQQRLQAVADRLRRQLGHQFLLGLRHLLRHRLHGQGAEQADQRSGRFRARPDLLGLSVGHSAAAAVAALVLPLLPHVHHAGTGLSVLHAGGLHHGRRRRVAAPVAQAQGDLHRRRLLRLVHHRPVVCRSGRDVRVPAVQQLRLQQPGPPVAHLLRVHRHFLGLRRQPLLRRPQGHDRLLPDPLVQVLLDRHHAAHLRGRVHLLPGRLHSADLPGLPLSLVGTLHRRPPGPVFHDLRARLHDLRHLQTRGNSDGETARHLLAHPAGDHHRGDPQPARQQRRWRRGRDGRLGTSSSVSSIGSFPSSLLRYFVRQPDTDPGERQRKCSSREGADRRPPVNIRRALQCVQHFVYSDGIRSTKAENPPPTAV